MTAADVGPTVGDQAARAARIRGFLLAIMRPADCMCDLIAVTLRCLIVNDSVAFLDAAAALLEREGVTVVGVASASTDALASSGTALRQWTTRTGDRQAALTDLTHQFTFT
jgi:hypothetical protein